MNQALSPSSASTRLPAAAELLVEELRQHYETFVFAGTLLLDEDGHCSASDAIGGHVLRSISGPFSLFQDLDQPSSEVVHMHWHQASEHPQIFPLRFKQRPERQMCVLLDRSHPAIGSLLLIREGLPENLQQPTTLPSDFSLWGRAIGDALWVWDVHQQKAYFSPRWYELLELPSQPPLTSLNTWLKCLSQQDLRTFEHALSSLSQGQQDTFELEQSLELSSGTQRWLSVRAFAERNGKDGHIHIAGTVTDITAHKHESERILCDSHHDSLTGLPNKLGFKHLAAHLHPYGSRRPWSLVLMGIGELARIHDTLGPATADQLLRHLANRLACLVRPDDVLARIDVDQFLVMLPGFEALQDLQDFTDKLTYELNQPFDIQGRSFCASVTMGIVANAEQSLDHEELLSDASLALLEARRNGGLENQFFSLQLRTANARRMMLEPELRRALDRNELLLAYQPIISLSSGTLLGFEALCRWKHHEHGFIGPDEFIPLAEDNGLIRHIGAWVLRKACSEALKWPALPSGKAPWVAVNVSGRQLIHPNFVAEIRSTLQETGLPAEQLHLELTESVLMDNPEIARRVLTDLRNLGIHLSIDDFGTGYSSLAYLRSFPIGTLKIDRTFLSKGPNQESSWTIIETIQALATALNIDVVVEGVETLEHINRLRRMGCHGAQGYLLSRPIPSDQLSPYMSELRIGCVPVNTHCSHD